MSEEAINPKKVSKNGMEFGVGYICSCNDLECVGVIGQEIDSRTGCPIATCPNPKYPSSYLHSK